MTLRTLFFRSCYLNYHRVLSLHYTLLVLIAIVLYLHVQQTENINYINHNVYDLITNRLLNWNKLLLLFLIMACALYFLVMWGR